MAKKVAAFDVHPGVAMMQSVVEKMEEKTGRTLEQWVALAKKSGPATEKERAAWLKSQHGLGTNYAAWIAGLSVGKSQDQTPEDYLAAAGAYVEQMFAGPKAGLRPIFDELLRLGRALGKDVKVCPCQTIVPLYRQHVFAQLKPSTRTRLDLGLSLKGVKVPARLIDTGGAAKGDRITHRIPLASVQEIDGDVRKWLQRAYELDG